MPLYHTTLFSNDAPGEAFVLRGAAWSFEKKSGLYQGPKEKIHDHMMKLRQERGHPATANHWSPEEPAFFDMEIMIRARGTSQAKRAMNLLVSAIAVFEGGRPSYPKPFSVEPWEVGQTALHIRTRS